MKDLNTRDNNSRVQDMVLSSLRDELKVSSIKLDNLLVFDLGLDVFDFASICNDLSAKLGISIKLEDFNYFWKDYTVSNFIDFVIQEYEKSPFIKQNIEIKKSMFKKIFKGKNNAR